MACQPCVMFRDAKPGCWIYSNARNITRNTSKAQQFEISEKRCSNGLTVDDFNFEEWVGSGGSHIDSPGSQFFRKLTTWDANHRGGETYRVGVTGDYRTRPDQSRPCTPHHNLGVAMLMTRKNRMSAVMLSNQFQDANPGTRFIRCLNSVTSQNCRINIKML